jgi:STE24 endopeptidase
MLMPAAPLLIALFVAFAADSIVPPVRAEDLASCLTETALALGLAASVAMGLGLGLTAAVRRRGYPTASSRRGLAWASYLVQAMNLVVFAWLIHGLGWPDFVRNGMGLKGVFVVDEVTILAPFLVAEVLGWWGLYPAARASRMIGAGSGPGSYLLRKARMAFGMILPAVVLFWAGADLAKRALGDSAATPVVQLGVMAAMGAVLLVISPAFVRLTWPARPLPAGPLRDRLERLAARFGFRFTDILLWDTEGSVFNAVVTGALPWFRYVLLSDALVDALDEHEVAAVFGHEMGHVRHRHLASFGLFFLGSLGVMALAGQLVDLASTAVGAGVGTGYPAVELAKSVTVLAMVGVYYWIAFGLLSRRFERQADVFGCRAISCGRDDCEQCHYEGPRNVAAPDSVPLCAVGIRICVNALETVAAENGIEPDSRSWRHGSIARRVSFLRGLQGHPEAERRFQSGVLALRLMFALLLAGACVLAFASGAFESLRGG